MAEIIRFGIVLQKIKLDSSRKTITFEVTTPLHSEYTEEDFLRTLLLEIQDTLITHPEVLNVFPGGVVRISGSLSVRMALAVGALVARLGARAIRFSEDGENFTTVISMTPQILPGMIVEITREGGLFARGARGVVVNVGKKSVNIAEMKGSPTRDTGWTAIENVRPAGWGELPVILGDFPGSKR